MNKINSYKDLIVWQRSVEFVTDIYSITNTFPEKEKFGIVPQLNRAAISIPSNIAEGWGRESSKSYMQFLKMSRGSLMEVETQIIISGKLNYLKEEELEELALKIEEIGKMLNALIKSIKRKVELN